MTNPIPEKVVNYNVYDDTEKLVGLTAEVTLPKLEAMTETISGAGILGEYDSANPGHFGSMEIGLTFRTLFDKSFSLLKSTGRPLIFRAAQQSYDVSQGRVLHRGLKITINGQPKGLGLGKLGVGAATETENTMEILYIKIEENGKVLLELDKLNYIYILDGEDMLKDFMKFI
ncbi:phage tail protein [Bacillaceae bacterium SAOS 7]|nr:phage tail protein [Bacillaceae bacterium SAOS 7]